MIGQFRLPTNPEQVNPCPRCGGTRLYIYEGKSPKECGFIHICDDGDYSVKVESRLFETEQEAIKAWNKRYDSAWNSSKFWRRYETTLYIR